MSERHRICWPCYKEHCDGWAAEVIDPEHRQGVQHRCHFCGSFTPSQMRMYRNPAEITGFDCSLLHPKEAVIT